MEHDQRDRKIKLIGLILICDWLRLVKDPPTSIKDAIERAMEVVFWRTELFKLSAPIPRFEKGGTEINQ